MKRTVWLQETRQMRFDAPHPWGTPCGRPSDVPIRARRYIDRYEEAGWDGGQRSYSWVKNTLQAAHRVAPTDAMTNRQDGRFARPQAARRVAPTDAMTNRQDRRFARPQAAHRVAPRDGRNERPGFF